MFSYFEPNFLEKFLWESGFSNFCQNQNDTKQKSVIWQPFWNGTTFLIFFPGLWFFIVHTHMVQISLQNSGRKVVFYAWVPRNPPPPLGHQRVGAKYLGHLSVKGIGYHMTPFSKMLCISWKVNLCVPILDGSVGAAAAFTRVCHLPLSSASRVWTSNL